MGILERLRNAFGGVCVMNRALGELDEVYAGWHDCPNPQCKCSTILEEHNYCPGCGTKIHWHGVSNTESR